MSTPRASVCLLLQPLVLMLLLEISGTQAACNTCSGITSVPHGYHSISYSESNDFIDNPDRGFYQHLETHVSNFDPLTTSQLDDYRAKEGVSLALRLYSLDGYAARSLPSSFLDHVRADLQILRQAGWTTVLRFAYTLHQESSAPYGDATLAEMRKHISQLKPLWSEFEGTIAVIQAGFIGTWGEWYYTTHFGDPRHPDPHGPHSLSLSHWQARKHLLEAVLDAAPKSIPVQIRTPYSKIQMFGTKTPTSLSEVMSGSHRGRTAHHNDCFLADDSDVGTYKDIIAEKAYLEADTLYLPIGGETCGRAHADSHGHRRSDCPTAVSEMKRFHWTFINRGYNPSVLHDWKSQGCYDDMRKHLGYRLYLKKAILPTSVSAGGDLCYHITLANSGYAAPFKDWAVSLVLKAGGTVYAARLSGVNVRTWLPGRDHVISGAVKVPSSLHGAFDLYMTIVDVPMTSHPDAYVLLANTGNHDPPSGLNPLQARVQISGHGSSSSSCPTVTSWTPPSHSRYPRMSGSHSPASHSSSCSPVSLSNPSFESHDHSWSSYHGGYSFSSSSPQDGSSCIHVDDGGAYQELTFSSPVHKLILTAYSRNTGHSHSLTDDYSLYCDITTASGSHVWGKNAAFTAGNKNWHKVQLNIDVAQGISKAVCYVLYRNLGSLGGHAYFDNVKAWTLPASASFSDCPT